jgi:HAD superfamily hydrolase (TIGR01509 family)
MIKALIFDFDGLILETEEPVYISWQEIYRDFECDLTFEMWSKNIGTTEEAFDPFGELERQTGRPLPRQEIFDRHHKREMELVLKRDVMPGVINYLEDARKLGLKIGLASSSRCDWVTWHLERLGLIGYFNSIKGADDVLRTKPDPELFQLVLSDLGVRPEQAVIFEDSVIGLSAAKKAGAFCVWIPNKLTSRLKTGQADLRLESLEELSLGELLLQFNNRNLILNSKVKK